MIKFGKGSTCRANSVSHVMVEWLDVVKKATCNQNQLKFLEICFECQIMPNFIKNAFNFDSKVFIDTKTKKNIDGTLTNILKCNIEKKIRNHASFNVCYNSLYSN